MTAELTKKKGHPKGLYLLFVTEMAERFSYYGMRGIFKLFLMSALYESRITNGIYGCFTGLVYLTPMLGGFVSDKYWGNRKCIIVGGILMAIGQFFMFFSSLFVKKSKFEETGSIDPNVNNNTSVICLGLGLVFLIFGNGFFKPNISVMVGDLYEPTDERKDSAYTIFYMGINVGAFFAPLICGSISPKSNGYLNPSGYKWGFLCAGIGMVLSILVFWLLMNKLIITPEGLQIGLPPSKDKVKEKRMEQMKIMDESIKAESGESEKPKELKKNSPLRGIISAVVGIAIACVYIFFLSDLDDNPPVMIYICEVLSGIVWGCFIGLPLYIITDKNLDREQRSRVGSIYIIAFFVVAFWSAYEQAGSSLTDLGEYQIDRNIFNKFTFSTTWFQCINPFFIVVLAPLFAYLWEFLNKRNLEPFSPVKQAIGLIILAFSYVVLIIGFKDVSEKDKANIIWLFLLYFVQTVAELFLSPIGNSLVYKLAPPHLSSLLMGVWLMSSAVSNVFAGKLANYSPISAKKDAAGNKIYSVLFGITMDSFTKFFSIFVVISTISGIMLFAFCPLLKRMMKGVK